MNALNARRISRQLAFTLIELLVIIVIVVLLFVLVFSGARRAKEEALRKRCTNNLKQVGTGFRQWCLDGGDKPPTQVTETRGGAEQAINRGEVFRVFQVMSNELGNPNILVCPSDDRASAPHFVVLQANTNVSYFIGLDALDTYPQMLLAGDRNLEIDGVAAGPGIVALTTNNVVGWTRSIHMRVGNVGLADGSVQLFNNRLIEKALAETGAATNRLAIP